MICGDPSVPRGIGSLGGNARARHRQVGLGSRLSTRGRVRCVGRVGRLDVVPFDRRRSAARARLRRRQCVVGIAILVRPDRFLGRRFPGPIGRLPRRCRISRRDRAIREYCDGRTRRRGVARLSRGLPDGGGRFRSGRVGHCCGGSRCCNRRGCRYSLGLSSEEAHLCNATVEGLLRRAETPTLGRSDPLWEPGLTNPSDSMISSTLLPGSLRITTPPRERVSRETCRASSLVP